MNLSQYNNNTEAVTHCAQYNNNNIIRLQIKKNNRNRARGGFFYFIFDRRACIFYKQSHIIYYLGIYRALYQKNNNSRHVWNFKVGHRIILYYYTLRMYQIRYIYIILCIIVSRIEKYFGIFFFVPCWTTERELSESIFDVCSVFFFCGCPYTEPSPSVVTAEWQFLVVDYVSSDGLLFLFCPQTDTNST